MTLFQDLIDRLTGYRRLTLTETQRMLVLRNGVFDAILGAGKHRLPRKDVLTELHDLENLFFVSSYERALMQNRPELAATHLTEFRAGPDEVLVLLRDEVPVRVLNPEARALVWKAAGPWKVEHHALTETMAVPKATAQRLVRAGLRLNLTQVEVADGHTGLLTVDGVFVDQLNPGAHAFWKVGRKVEVKQIDLRQRTHEVTGQEILTKDRVTIRVNLSADYRVVDPIKAVGAVKDFDQSLHRALQLAFRKTLGAMTLDRLLAEKVTVDTEAADRVRTQMAGIGIEVGEIALKDVILPGEMREILTAVVAAEKQAEANVIRRREETNATRSLLNTAKVMAENPVMLRLKELEALETIAGKVERLAVHNGTEGLMSDLVKLRD
ncbi:Modulator of FtsH protease HflK [Ruegeria denitrificans]|uniref:Modulator of FtsH protease HflK n=1 Tax=Ruegeria denitrificans TaxID=1715692 RepID=A0A0P1IGY8_9RHOB|nr:slipin family protein [Ruegeria denitrificans]CUK12642.1 Modulator of FtsH protease HflK [Ruegeria denitrificans]